MIQPLSFKTCRALAAAGLVGLASGPGLAHTYVLELGASATANSYFGVICSTDGGYETDHIYLQIQTLTPNAPLVSAQIIKGTVAASTTDPISGDAQPSAPIRVRGGNGLYQVLTNKTGAGAVSFSVTVHCVDASGIQHTGTDAVVYQYQDR